jgi:hypothetical protein
MLRITATAFISAVLALVTTPINHVPGTRPPATAQAKAAGNFNPVETAHGRVRAVAAVDFDPFGEIVPLPVFRLEQFRRPAFDPSLFRGGRAGEAMEKVELCEVIDEVADEFDLPSPLFARLIWQESRFRSEAVSRKGAQGIAQFMPRTAASRRLDDPFDPLQALPASADFLRELVEQFGNFGLAAAAYNGGPTRVRNWLAGRTRLPKETRDYVLHITGHPVEHWRKTAKGTARANTNNPNVCGGAMIVDSTRVPSRN